jgi:hypothetical protein
VAATPPAPPGGPPTPPPGAPPGSGPPAQYPPAYQPYPGQYPQPYPGQYPQQYAPPAHRRTFFLTLAQILTIIESILYVIFGVLVILAGTVLTSYITSNFSTFTVNGVTYDLTAYTLAFVIAGAIGVVIGLLLLWASIRMGKPSNGARWVVIIWQILLLLGGISGLVSRSGLYSLVVVVISVIVLYALLIDPPTRHAFTRR